MDASGDEAVSSELGDIYLTAPGTTQWAVTADSELGEREYGAELHRTAPGTTWAPSR